MARRLPILALALALAASLAGAPAAACSIGSGYRPPTNFELAAEADTIVLGTVLREERSGDGFSTKMLVRPTLLLKGAALPADVRLWGGLPRPGRRAIRSDPRELAGPNPNAFSGSCSRVMFEPGMQLVLFLERDPKGVLQVANPAYSRAAEDVPGPDAPWVKAVRLYARVSALPERRRRAALVARRDALRSSRKPDSALLAAEMDRQLEEGVEKRNLGGGLIDKPDPLIPIFGGKPARLPR